jgi:ParB-like chromosome segregation protein Spo0J
VRNGTKIPPIKAWPADKVERRSIDSLIPYAKNPRTHSEKQVDQIAKSIMEFGFTVPVLVDGAGNVIAGHGRLLAAKQLGLADVPVMVADGWSEAKRRAYVILDNKLAANSGWDNELLRAEFADLDAAGFDIGSLGFEPPELAAIRDAAGAGNVQAGRATLAARFGAPPFSVLNAREGWWQDRKRAWIALGIQSELGRGQERLGMAHPATTATIDFYAQKRALEAELGGALSTPEAKAILAGRGMIRDDRAVNARRKANAIPGGGTGPNSVWRKRGRKVVNAAP